MRNLSVLQQRHAPAALSDNSVDEPSHHPVQCVGPDGHVWVAYSADCIAEYPADLSTLLRTTSARPGGHVISLEFLALMDMLCAVLATGEIMTFSIHSQQWEDVGDVDNGVAAAAWSPDQEMLVVISGAGSLMSLTKDFQPLVELPVEAGSFGADAPVTVGWGSRETQFQGKAGKLVNQPKLPEAEVPYDDGLPRISWRGDGQYFVTSTHAQERRLLRVWNRELVLQSTSEHVGGLEFALAWRPSGNLIASSQRLPHRHDVVFFERNGLRHGEFTLPFKQNEVVVKALAWNADSNILAIWLQTLATDEKLNRPQQAFLQLWTCSNYHWYLKQSLQFDSNHSFQGFAWHSQEGRLLFYICNNRVSQLHLAFQACASGNSPAVRHLTDPAAVMVIDGKMLNITPLGRVVVPPPMADVSVDLGAPISCVAFACTPVASSCAAAVATSDLHIHLLGHVGSPDHLQPLVLAKLALPAALASSQGPVLLRHLCWLSPTLLTAVCAAEAGDVLWALRLSVAPGSGTNASVEINRATPYPLTASILATTPLEDGQGLLLQDAEGKLQLAALPNDHNHHIQDSASTLSVAAWSPLGFDVESFTLAVPCEFLVHTYVGDGSGASVGASDSGRVGRTSPLAQEEKQHAVLGLTSRHQLVLNDSILANGCNSFAVHQAYVVCCSDQHACCFLERRRLLQANDFRTSKRHPYDHGVRAVERGASIVTVPYQGIDLILQMPRGNLELVAPRALVLHRCAALLSRKQYKAAFSLLRKHRLSLNLLHDYDPATFMAEIAAFVAAVPNPDNLNLFLSELVDDDVTFTMYPPVSSETGITSKITVPGKVNRLCDAIRQQVTQLDPNRYLTTILTSYLKSLPPRPEDALNHVLALHQQAEADTALAEKPRAALKYMMLLMDVDVLYNTALAAYNLPFALMVAQVAQKDPKEYLPFLQALRREPEQLRRYQIDLYLKHYDRAVKNLAAAGAEHADTCISLAKEHRLFPILLAVYHDANQKVLYARAAVAYARELQTGKHYSEAAVLFEAGQELAMALQAYTAAGDWQQAMTVAAQLGESEAALAERATQLAELLRFKQRYAEAARVLEIYANNVEATVALYIEAACWHDAVRLAQRGPALPKAKEAAQATAADQPPASDLVENLVKPQLALHLQQVVARYQEISSTIQQRTARLQVVRENKAREAALIEDGGPAGAADGDVYSEASAPASRMSGTSVASSSRRSRASSGKTARSRRRNEAKKYSLREGGPYEEEALVHAIHQSIKQVDDGAGQVRDTSLAAVRMGLQSQAAELQRVYAETRQVCKSCIPQVWTPAATAAATGGSDLLLGSGADLSTSARIAAAMLAQQRQQNSGAGDAAGDDRQISSTEDTVPMPARPVLCDESLWKLRIF